MAARKKISKQEQINGCPQCGAQLKEDGNCSYQLFESCPGAAEATAYEEAFDSGIDRKEYNNTMYYSLRCKKCKNELGDHRVKDGACPLPDWMHSRRYVGYLKNSITLSGKFSALRRFTDA